MKLNKLKLIDFIFIFGLVCSSVFSIQFFIYKNDRPLIAVIEQDNHEINRINLSDVTESYFIDINSNYPTKILVEPGKISFYNSTCPDKICEHYGKLSKKGQVAVCLPAKTFIRIDGQNQNIDSITG